MKSWLAKFKISAALDSGQPLPPSTRNRIARSPELLKFERDAAALARLLRQAPPRPAVPDSFHTVIMQSVRAAALSAAPEAAPVFGWAKPASFVRRLSAPAFALVLLALIGWLVWSRQSVLSPSSPESRVLAGAPSALELSGAVTRTVPEAVFSPLAEEWNRLNRDLDRTAEFLLASLP